MKAYKFDFWRCFQNVRRFLINLSYMQSYYIYTIAHTAIKKLYNRNFFLFDLYWGLYCIRRPAQPQLSGRTVSAGV